MRLSHAHKARRRADCATRALRAELEHYRLLVLIPSTRCCVCVIAYIYGGTRVTPDPAHSLDSPYGSGRDIRRTGETITGAKAPNESSRAAAAAAA